MMRPAPVVFLLACALGAQQQPEPSPSPGTDAAVLERTVRGAVAWIARQAVPVEGEGEGEGDAVAFKATEGKGKGRAGPAIVYGGSAGVLVFLENAAKVLDDATARELADRAAKGLRALKRVDDDGRATWARGALAGAGLYAGDAGIGQAFLVRHELRGDAAALATAVEIGDALLARGERDGEELTWGGASDIIFGEAGVALFLLDLGHVSGAQRFVDAAHAAARFLLHDADTVASASDPARQLRKWLLQMGGMRRHMPNFSHGTAGVAYALARVGAAVGDEQLIQGAIDGADWLLEHAVADGDGLKWACVEGGPPVFMGGWCHGPAGTGRLFLLLHSITGEQRFRDAATKGARFVVEYARRAELGGKQGERPYVPPSYCCGVAGVVDFFCDLHRYTGDAADAAFAHKAGAYLVEVAIADGDGCKWRNGQTVPGGPMAADASACNVDLMIGAAGEALALLRLLTLDRPADPVRGMPDRAITAPPR